MQKITFRSLQLQEKPVLCRIAEGLVMELWSLQTNEELSRLSF